MLKSLVIFVAFTAFALSSMQGQTVGSAGGNHQDSTGASDSSLGRDTDHPQPHITTINPPPAPAASTPWPIHEKISWAANIILVVLGYVGIMIAVSSLKKIEHQTGYIETAAQAALEAANAASLNAQSILNSERPWILIRVEASQKAENSFKVMATNRGRGPAQIISSTERIGLATDELHLPKEPEYAKEKTNSLPGQVILLPGESMVILPFSRNDVKWICKTEESLRRVERWQDTIYIYGKIIYRDLLAPYEKQTHETQWCCSYSHGESNSELTIAGPPDYNKHT